MVLIFYNGSEAEGREHYKVFFDLGTHHITTFLRHDSSLLNISLSGPINDATQEIPYEEMNAITVCLGYSFLCLLTVKLSPEFLHLPRARCLPQRACTTHFKLQIT
jgi:hypothetical protein